MPWHDYLILLQAAAPILVVGAVIIPAPYAVAWLFWR